MQINVDSVIYDLDSDQSLDQADIQDPIAQDDVLKVEEV